jgi:ParB family chromosome partitioning protein
MASIAEKGLLHPIIVRPMGERFEVVAGNRRFAACKQLSWKRITCHILELDDKDAFEVSLMENLQHRTLNAVEEAVAFKKYVDAHGWGSVSDLAKKIGKSHSFVSNRIRLLELPSDILQKIVSRQTNSSVIQEVLAIDGNDERRMLAEEILCHNLTRTEVRKIIHHEDLEEYDYVSNICLPSRAEIEIHEKEKAILRFITSLRIALMRLDDTMEAIGREDWILWQNLMHHRAGLHASIDELIVLKKKSRMYHDKLRSLS